MEKRIRIRATIKGQITRANTTLTQIEKELPELDVRTIENRYTAFCSLLAKFDEIQSEIERNCEKEDEFKQQEAERIKFEEEFYNLDGRYLKIIDEYKARTVIVSNSPDKVKLPAIELPSFDGKMTEYLAFMDVFESIVHRNEQLKEVDKLIYLKSALRGEASQLVESLSTTSGNYQAALSILRTRYYNIRCIKQAHFENLFGLAEVKSRSVKSLRNLIDTTQNQLNALAALGENVMEWNNLLVYLVSSKLDYESRRQFEIQFATQEPQFEQLKQFINNKCAAMERAENNNETTIGLQDLRRGRLNQSCGAAINNSNFKAQRKCFVCDGEHKLLNCPQFLKLTPNEKYLCAKRKELCINCLRPGHKGNSCVAPGCGKCSKNHHTMLHFVRRETTFDDHVKSNSELDEPKGKTAIVHYSSVALKSNVSNENMVFLFTAVVQIRSSEGFIIEARALIDPGSQVNFVTNGLLKRLKLQGKSINCNVDGVGENATPVESFVDMEIRSVCNNFCMFDRFLVLKSITKNLPQASVNLDSGLYEKLNLADPYFYKSGSIDLLLSNKIFVKIMKTGSTIQFKNGLKAFDTEFGYLVGGSLSKFSESYKQDSYLCSCVRAESPIIDIRQFWELENFINESKNEKLDVNKPILEDYKRDDKGKFIIKLPLRPEVKDLSHSKELALNRFRYLEKKFKLDAKFAENYKNVMLEYINKNFVELVTEENQESTIKYYLPHHAVLKESSTTTKLRIVFDGSAAPINCQSLNSVLYTGKKLQNDLVRTLLKFRTYAIAFIADIEKMYCQIKVRAGDRDLLRFFWRFSFEEPVMVYRLVSLPFGLNCSPNLAIGCLKELARLNLEMFPEASKVLLYDSYMDDVISGADNLENAQRLANDLSGLCNLGGFQLRKWASNSSHLLNSVEESTEIRNFEVNGEDTKILGLRWSTQQDNFGFCFKWNIPTKLTKRSVLSFLAGIFDPMGFLSPVVVMGKILLQEIWLIKIDWDQELPSNMADKWNKLFLDLKGIDRLDLSRYVGNSEQSKMFAFCDASERAYGAVVYLRCGDRLNLVFAKSRVAPLKTISLARLELCAALLGARAVKYVAESLGIGLDKCVLFSDSSIVLAWIAKPSYNWKCFVANRVAEIQEISSECRWYHVSSKENPADLISRGCLLSDLIQNKLWWNGPSWLREVDESGLKIPNFETKKEFKGNKVNLSVASMIAVTAQNHSIEAGNEMLLELVNRFSSFGKLLRIFAWVRRYLNNLRPGVSKNTSSMLSVIELDDAMFGIIKFIQKRHFYKTIVRLMDKKFVKAGDSLASLDPFLDENLILRVGGRLKNSQLSFGRKHPIILPKGDIVTKSIIREEHVRCNHLGTSGLINILRQRFWIINSRSTVRSVLRKCVPCFRCHPLKGSQLMGELPIQRIESVRTFNKVGIDLCGPFYVRPTRKRGNTTTKCFVALFICLATKAIHLEIVFDLSTESFIAAFRRFCGRRGMPNTIYTDNATNFVGARNKMEEWYKLLDSDKFKLKFQSDLANDRIFWKFIPPRTPSFGGLWEGNIRSFKTLFKKCAGESRLTFEEFTTLLIQVEAALNSRPLCVISENSDELDSLTPGHFLIGQPLKMLPCPVSHEFSGNITKRWNLVQEIFRNFWRRWSVEYLQELQNRKRNKLRKPNLKVGDVGLLVDDALPPFKWKLGRVVEVFPGKDDLVRVINIKTESKILKRGVERFCKLEIE